MRLPTQEEAERTMGQFWERFKIPSVFGCIDGTLIAIQRPTEDEAAYVCRKQFHALNVQVGPIEYSTECFSLSEFLLCIRACDISLFQQ